jgi:hypothetical protein
MYRRKKSASMGAIVANEIKCSVADAPWTPTTLGSHTFIVFNVLYSIFTFGEVKDYPSLVKRIRIQPHQRLPTISSVSPPEPVLPLTILILRSMGTLCV